jgi:hypothetical protein
MTLSAKSSFQMLRAHRHDPVLMSVQTKNQRTLPPRSSFGEERLPSRAQNCCLLRDPGMLASKAPKKGRQRNRGSGGCDERLSGRALSPLIPALWGSAEFGSAPFGSPPCTRSRSILWQKMAAGALPPSPSPPRCVAQATPPPRPLPHLCFCAPLRCDSKINISVSKEKYTRWRVSVQVAP